MTFEEAIQGAGAPADLLDQLQLLDLPFVDFEGIERMGQLVVHQDVAEDVGTIFQELFEARFPIACMEPIVKYDWDDFASIKANNTSAFNYRVIFGTDRLSNHSFGKAIDINPVQNPYFGSDGESLPPGYVYDLDAKGVIKDGDVVVEAFLKRGWTWGGHWETPKDYQHFEKK